MAVDPRNGQLGDPASAVPTKCVCLHFRISFMTRWGESLVVSGPGKTLGNSVPAQGLRMSCHHAGEELIWEVKAFVPYVPKLWYR